MATPGFTAPASLRPTAQQYRERSSLVMPSGAVVPQLDAVVKGESPEDEEGGTSTTTVSVSTDSASESSSFFGWLGSVFSSKGSSLGGGFQDDPNWVAQEGYGFGYASVGGPRANCEVKCDRPIKVACGTSCGVRRLIVKRSEIGATPAARGSPGSRSTSPDHQRVRLAGGIDGDHW